jgi:MoaA/NifB/PqqE/SkfB family radical SAM enzyme
MFMLDLARRYPGYLLFHQFGFPKFLPVSLAVSVTHRCNARCMTCKVTRKKPDELTLNEYIRIFKSMHGIPRWFTITGGEPFMRRDLSEIAGAMAGIVEPDAITLATNAFYTDRLQAFARNVVREYPKVRFIVNLSVDGIGPAHDKIRGLPGSFERVKDSFLSLKNMELGNLKLGFHTVISKFNAHAVPDLMEYLKVFEPDHHHFEIAQTRAELNVKNEDLAPPLETYEELTKLILERSNNKKEEGFVESIRLFRREYYVQSVKTLRQKEQVSPCFAGYASGQIGPNGDVWACCVLARTMGNLREKDYDFDAVWTSRRADSVRRTIRDNGCFCPMANAMYTSMLLHPATLTRVLMKHI